MLSNDGSVKLIAEHCRDDIVRNGVKSRASNKNGFHILVVDDDSEILESVGFALKQNGFLVSSASDGNQALAIAETIIPELIVLDLMMPRRSGFLVLEQLCQTAENPIPVVVITGNEGKRHRDYALMLGASDYLLKPFVIDRLLESINKLLVVK